jgi:hypothetical protein
MMVEIGFEVVYNNLNATRTPRWLRSGVDASGVPAEGYYPSLGDPGHKDTFGCTIHTCRATHVATL